MVINLLPNKPWFLHVCSMSFENTMGKGEVVSQKQFLLFPVFSIHLENFLPFSSNFKFSSVLGRLENIVGKGENAGDQHFLLF